MDEYVGDFEVSMHRIDLMKSSEPVEDLFQEGGCLIFCQSLFFVEIHFQIASVAKLHCNKLSFFRTECVYIANHVLIVTFLENSNLSLDEFLEFRGVNHELSGDGLDGDNTASVLIKGLVDYGPCSFPKFPHERKLFHLLALHIFMLHFLLLYFKLQKIA